MLLQFEKILKKCEGVSSHDTSYTVPHDLQHMQHIHITITDNHKHYHIEANDN